MNNTVIWRRFGNGEAGMGSIADWEPAYYTPEEVTVPPFVPDTPVAREEIAAQYTTISRLDQGIGLVVKELESKGTSNGFRLGSIQLNQSMDID